MSLQYLATAAFLAHIVSQTEQNVNFLASQNYISQGDAIAFLAKLPNASDANTITKEYSAGTMASLASRVSNVVSGKNPPPTPRQVPPSVVQAWALWAYKNGQYVGDPSFSAGGIGIVKGANTDRWKLERRVPAQLLCNMAPPLQRLTCPVSNRTFRKIPDKPLGELKGSSVGEFNQDFFRNLMETGALLVKEYIPHDYSTVNWTYDQVLDYLNGGVQQPLLEGHTPGYTFNILYYLRDEFHTDLEYLKCLILSLTPEYKIALQVSFLNFTSGIDLASFKEVWDYLVNLPGVTLVISDVDTSIIGSDNEHNVVGAPSDADRGSPLSPKPQSTGIVGGPTSKKVAVLSCWLIRGIRDKFIRSFILLALNTASLTFLEFYECTCDWPQILPSLKLERLNQLHIIEQKETSMDPRILSDFLTRHPLIHTLLLIGDNHFQGVSDKPKRSLEEIMSPAGTPILPWLRSIGGSPLYLYLFLQRIELYPKIEEISLNSTFRSCGCQGLPTDYSLVFNTLVRMRRKPRSYTLCLTSLHEAGIFPWLLKNGRKPRDGRITSVTEVVVRYHNFSPNDGSLVGKFQDKHHEQISPGLNISFRGTALKPEADAEVLLPHLTGIFPKLRTLAFLRQN